MNSEGLNLHETLPKLLTSLHMHSCVWLDIQEETNMSLSIAHIQSYMTNGAACGTGRRCDRNRKYKVCFKSINICQRLFNWKKITFNMMYAVRAI